MIQIIRDACNTYLQSSATDNHVDNMFIVFILKNRTHTGLANGFERNDSSVYGEEKHIGLSQLAKNPMLNRCAT